MFSSFAALQYYIFFSFFHINAMGILVYYINFNRFLRIHDGHDHENVNRSENYKNANAIKILSVVNI